MAGCCRRPTAVFRCGFFLYVNDGGSRARVASPWRHNPSNLGLVSTKIKVIAFVSIRAAAEAVASKVIEIVQKTAVFLLTECRFCVIRAIVLLKRLQFAQIV